MVPITRNVGHWGTEIAALIKAKRQLMEDIQAQIERLERRLSEGWRFESDCPTPKADGSCPGHKEEA